MGILWTIPRNKAEVRAQIKAAYTMTPRASRMPTEAEALAERHAAIRASSAGRKMLGQGFSIAQIEQKIEEARLKQIREAGHAIAAQRKPKRRRL